MILTSTVFDRPTRVTDGQTDGRAIAYSALSICCHALKTNDDGAGKTTAGKSFYKDAAVCPFYVETLPTAISTSIKSIKLSFPFP